MLDNALVELVEAPQVQYFGRLKYDIKGEEKALDEKFEMSKEMGELSSVTIQTNKNKQGLGEMFSMGEEESDPPKDKPDRRYSEGDYRSRSPVSIQEQRSFVDEAKRKEKKKKKAIERFWENDEATLEQDEKVNVVPKKKLSGKTEVQEKSLDSFFD
ncbi:MAG: hypothetical protein IH840_16220 [Candidatus Heimdallarchaeota archaeon]|nr:hypothetical protein [Candidatus Heimdallarchaeota archaeon]